MFVPFLLFNCCWWLSLLYVLVAQVNDSLSSRECYHLNSCSYAPAPQRSHPGDFEPNSQSTAMSQVFK